jgi:hypothetical protein
MTYKRDLITNMALKMGSIYLQFHYLYMPERLQCDDEDHLDIFVPRTACCRVQPNVGRVY